jgi:hypothetical protein
MIGDCIGVLTLVSILVYSPFAKNWWRALGVPFALTLVWGIVRIVSIILFREDSPPGVGFFIAPCFAALFGGLSRALKLLLFEIPILAEKVEQFRSRFFKDDPS